LIIRKEIPSNLSNYYEERRRERRFEALPSRLSLEQLSRFHSVSPKLVHDSQTAVPLATMTASRVTNLYDLMDAAYCSTELQEHSRSLGHVPLIDHNPRGGEKDQVRAG
jgi:hypothetical protein